MIDSCHVLPRHLVGYVYATVREMIEYQLPITAIAIVAHQK